jgi:hypothetical protein
MAVPEVRYTPQRLTRAGVAAAAQTAVIAGTQTYVMRNDGKTFFRFYKTGANTCTVTITAQATIKGQTVTNWTYTVPATTGDIFTGFFEPALWNDANGDLRFQFSEVTAMFFYAFSTG